MTSADQGAGGATPGEEPQAKVEAVPPAPTPKRRHVARVVAILAVIILSIATVSSAWSAYEATRWSGVQATNYSQASASRTESTRQSNRANTLSAIDVQLFSDWVAALSQKDTRRADFLRERFREEFRPAFTVWLNSVPKGTIPGQPLHPARVLARGAT